MELNLKPKMRVAFDPLELSRRDRERVIGLGRGWSYKQIAYEMGSGTNTVKTDMARLFLRSGMSKYQLAVLGSRMLEAMAS